MPAHRDAVAWTVAVLAPVFVVVGLYVLHSLPSVLATYQIGLGLVWSLFVARRLARRTWPEHLRDLGLTGPAPVRGVRLGLALGTLFFAAPIVRWLVWPDWSPGAAHLREVVAGWGVDRRAPGVALAVLALVNGPAEELLWRGYLQHRLLHGRADFWRRALVLSVLFTSYHTVTIGALAPTGASLAGRLAVVLGAGLFWAWSRRRWGSLWPALLSHTGATFGYVTVAVLILRSG